MEEIKKDINKRFDGLETKFDGLESKVDNLEVRFDGLEEQVDSLAISTKNGFDEMRSEQRDLAAKILEKIELMHDEMRDMKRVESSLVQSQASTDRITTDHEGRLTKIEGHLELV